MIHTSHFILIQPPFKGISAPRFVSRCQNCGGQRCGVVVGKGVVGMVVVGGGVVQLVVIGGVVGTLVVMVVVVVLVVVVVVVVGGP